MRHAKASLSDLRNIHISQFDDASFREKDVGWLDIPMEDVQSMQFSESLHDLRKDAPDLLLSRMGALLLVLDDLVAEVAFAGVFHNDAERLGGLIDKRLSVGDNIGMPDRGKDPYLIERVFFLLRTQVHYFDTL